jgi:Asp-tRNA(Asn)/Glu-tRNA(Gln) amidotransferase A subunit family amidase
VVVRRHAEPRQDEDVSAAADLSARAAAAAVAAGSLKAEALVEAYLQRVAAIEPQLRSFAFLDPELAYRQARAIDGSRRKGALAGVPVGVKDIIDTADQPTECNSPVFLGHQPEKDADCVAAVRAASGVVFGKTVTTEFANTRPGPTANPYSAAHTPGGSSSGSAAAVAAGLVPLAFGTQTGGSVIRPASFCGCVGYKATRQSLSTRGVHPLAPELDTLGLYARSPDDLLLFHSVLAGVKDTRPTPPGRPRLAVVQTAMWPKAEPASADLLHAAAGRLAPHALKVDRVELPSPCDARCFAAQEVLIIAGMAEAFAEMATSKRDLLSVAMVQNIEKGRAYSPAFLAEARETRAACIAAADRFFDDYDAILTPAAPGEAPAGFSSTGSPDFNRLWTFLDTPCVSLPVGLGPGGLPVGLQLVGRRGSDRALLALADWALALLGRCPAPALPSSRPMAGLARRAGLALDDDLSSAWAEGDRVLQEMAARLPRDLPYELEPAHVFQPSRRSGR